MLSSRRTNTPSNSLTDTYSLSGYEADGPYKTGRIWRRPSFQSLWIQPEENFLSALIRPPSRPEPIAPEYTLVAKLDRSTRNSSGPPDRPPQDNLQEQALARQEWPHPNTTTMVLYMQKMKWRTRIHAEITLHKHTMDNGH